MRLTNLVMKIETIKSSVELEKRLKNAAVRHWIGASRGDEWTVSSDTFCPPPLMFQLYDMDEEVELLIQNSFDNEMEHPGGIGFELQYLNLLD